MAESKELTKEQQVRALREARYKKRVTLRDGPAVTPVTIVTPVTHDRIDWQQRCRQLDAQLVHLESEIKWLKQQLAKTADGHAPLTGAERMRRMRSLRKHPKDG